MFNLKASIGQVIGISELYSSESVRHGGIAWVKANAPTATVDGQT
ncbi:MULTISPECIES: YegP family protein [Lysobacter]|nr:MULTISPECIES: YegP family protein [Lysobacter]UJB19648.1 YegP family protein [Lysobacter capsici]UJQ26626.1 YegP family protein [Lysobacter gummosus]